jgi:hypothetical protein
MTWKTSWPWPWKCLRRDCEKTVWDNWKSLSIDL